MLYVKYLIVVQTLNIILLPFHILIIYTQINILYTTAT